MRAVLDGIYRASGALAASCVVAIAVAVLLQVGANVIDWAIGLVRGAPVGLVIPSYSEFTGFFLIGASFLALAATLRLGGHIRVSLLVRSLKGRARKAAELWCCIAGATLAIFFAAYAFEFTSESFRYNDLSPGIVAVPLWIPQGSMVLGLVVLAVALLDEAWTVAKGGTPGYAIGDDVEGPASPAKTPGIGE